MKHTLLYTTLLCTILSASELSHTLSNQGFTGVINTPNAQVMKQGDLTVHFDNQFDYVLSRYNYDAINHTKQDYIFGAGLFPYFEVQGRLSEAKGYHRDLSANLKFQLPYKHKYLPNIAVGVQDLGSAASYYGNKYIVMDKELWFVRASLGYGKSDTSSLTRADRDLKRMDGIFGTLEVKTFDWLYLLAEDAAQERFAGLRVEMPRSWSPHFKLNTLITSNLSDNNSMSVGVNLTFPLYENKESYSSKTTNLYKQEVLKESASEETIERVEKKETKEITKEDLRVNLTLQEIKQKLVSFDIENVSIATKDESVYLAYENSVFLHNDLDAIGIILGLLSQTEYKKFILEQKRSKTTVITLEGSLEKAREFFQNPTLTNKELFASSIKKVSPKNLDGFEMDKIVANPSTFRPKITLKPFMKTFIGNEFGLFNYMLWLRAQAQVNIYKGIDLTAVADIHIHDSEIDDHQYDAFMMLYSDGSYLSSVMLNSSNNILGAINTLSVGTLEQNYVGVMDQLVYNKGNHTLKLKAGYFEQYRDGDAFKEYWLGKFISRRVLLVKYSYFVDSLDTLLEIKAGQYWNQDQGFEVRFKRYFGDTAVYLTYDQSKAYQRDSSYSEQTDRYAGIGVEIPLTLRHTPSFKAVQLKGTNAFSYKVKTTILREDGTNNLVPGGNYDPSMVISSEEYYLNRNRLQLSYIKSHLFKMKEAFDEYVVGE
ncbi:hypothetical protein GJV85_09780 [Sulfurimonas aquatica]|uniref:YjbH domain-containing protein n=1 Tax=Sulfurimonas aquatica TaxID=2672570 RepID=A0A975GDA4_9BACT|nr:YjbH domain-containing protein [Sulfurimonas aquatica]QSZ42382.1 hypothetical protein GJV85_09780 [Sulfurimonas aquatica]